MLSSWIKKYLVCLIVSFSPRTRTDSDYLVDLYTPSMSTLKVEYSRFLDVDRFRVSGMDSYIRTCLF